jgi:hypothetical protein
MPSLLITVDGPGQVYSGNCQTMFPFSVGSSGGIFRGLGASAHTVPDSLGALSTLTLLLQRLYTSEYIISDQNNQCIMEIDTNYYVMLY